MLNALPIELRHLAALQAVAEEGSFQRAARRLDYTQSAVSQQIAALERAVGHRLLNRARGAEPITLTHAGALLLRHAATIQDELAAAKSELAALERGAGGTLRIGTFQSVGVRLLPEIIRRSKRSDELDVTLVERPSDDELLPLLERGQLDVSFAELPLPSGRFASRTLLADEYVLVVSASSAFARDEPLRLEDIAELPLIAFKHGRSAERVLAHLGFEPNVVLRADDTNIIQAAVASGLGAALMPKLAVETDRENVRVLDLPEHLPRRVIVAAWRADRPPTPALSLFLQVSADVAAAVASTLR